MDVDAAGMLRAMSKADEWRAVCEALTTPDAGDHASLSRSLYELARGSGVALLRKRWGYSEEAALDVVHDVLAARWDEILGAEESPRALFLTMLARRAIDRHRRAARERALPEEASERAAVTERPSARLELARVIALLQRELSPRDLRVFAARCMGETAKEVAKAEQLSPANVDQIVSRARARLKELLDEDPE